MDKARTQIPLVFPYITFSYLSTKIHFIRNKLNLVILIFHVFTNCLKKTTTILMILELPTDVIARKSMN